MHKEFMTLTYSYEHILNKHYRDDMYIVISHKN